MPTDQVPAAHAAISPARPAPRRSIDALCVVGHPSRLGGADTELDHQIRCWQAMGVEVHLCHTGPVHQGLKAMGLARRGCVYHCSRDWPSLSGMHCISFCNGEFLSNLPEIKRHARTTTFVNCMTWSFDKEIEMQQRGLIDFHLYQTEHAFHRISPKLKGHGTYRPLFFVPYFHTQDFPFIPERPADKFRFGRISRDDLHKHGERQLWIYETMTAPVLKEGMILGWGPQAEKRYGRSPDCNIRTYREGEISQREFYSFCDAVIMTSHTFENLPRTGFEAMSSGSVLVVDDRGGWKLQVEDGATGWLCADDRQFAYKSSRCAFEAAEREAMRHAARVRLERGWGIEASMKSWELVFRAWESF